jgi:hypothetical protein
MQDVNLTYLIFTLASLVYILMLVGYKYEFPLLYENWYDKLPNNRLKKILQQDYCELCTVFHTSQTVSVITAIILQLPFVYIITLGVLISAIVLVTLRITK